MMLEKLKNPIFLKTFLILIAIHSLIVGLNLIFFPPEWMSKFGFKLITENFFKVQGGVFHLVLVVAYVMAAVQPNKCKSLIVFSIMAKFFATIFLFSYYLLFQTAITVLFSGIADFLMGLMLLYLFIKVDLKSGAESKSE